MVNQVEKVSYRKGKIPFLAAKLCEFNSGWVIEYSFTDPKTHALTKQRIKVNKERKTYSDDRVAKDKLWKKCKEIDKQLSEGWTPRGNLIQDVQTEDSLFYMLDLFLSFKEKELRPDSIRVLKSSVKRLKFWLKDRNLENISVYDFDGKLLVKFVDYLILKEKISNRVYNNTKAHFRSIWNWMIQERKIEISNPFKDLRSKPNEKVDIKIIPCSWDERILDYCRNHDPILELVCQLIMGPSFMRPSEIARCKIRCVNLEDKYIFLENDMTKMNNARLIYLSDRVVEILKDADIESMDKNHYLIGKGCGRTAPLQMGSEKLINTRDIDKNWEKLRLITGLPKVYRIYSWKYRGIGELYELGHSLDQISQLTGHLSDEIKTYLPNISKQLVAKNVALDSKGICRSSKPE